MRSAVIKLHRGTILEMEVTVVLAEQDVNQLRTELDVDSIELAEPQRSQVKLLLKSGKGTVDSVKALRRLLDGSTMRIHELLERASVQLPTPPPPPPRNAELDKRVQRMKAAQVCKCTDLC